MELRTAFRPARRTDVDAIVALLADDPLGATRERYRSPLPQSYYDAFDAIASDPNNELVVATADDRIVGVMQMTFIPYLTYQGRWRAQIEGVRVHSSVRAQGIGRRMMEWAIARARERRCHLLQLTTDKLRSDARRFYESLGFVASHEGMKLHLDRAAGSAQV